MYIRGICFQHVLATQKHFERQAQPMADGKWSMNLLFKVQICTAEREEWPNYGREDAHGDDG